MSHEFITHQYKMPITYELTLISVCCKCGNIEVKNADRVEQICSGKMHKNSSVKMMNMKPYKK